MSDYVILTDNTFTVPDAPIVIEVGKKITKISGYQCIVKLSNSQYSINPIQGEGIYKISANTVQCSDIGSYSILVKDTLNNDTAELFNIYIYLAPELITQKWLLSLINSELPTLYKANNILNNADNVGISTVFGEIYKYLYELYFNSITSVGAGRQYNKNWEYAYVGVNNFLQNASYPSDFIRTLMQIPTKTGVSMVDIAIFASRLSYQFTGTNTPCYVYFDSISNIYNITLYPSSVDAWELGIVGASELGVNTYLGGSGTYPYLYILSRLISQLLPITVKYEIGFLNYQGFTDLFNVDEVAYNEYINPSVKYDAYMVVNNNNQFNTKGYYLNG